MNYLYAYKLKRTVYFLLYAYTRIHIVMPVIFVPLCKPSRLPSNLHRRFQQES